MIEGPEIILFHFVFTTDVVEFLCLLFLVSFGFLVDTDKKRLFRERCVRNSAKALAAHCQGLRLLNTKLLSVIRCWKTLFKCELAKMLKFLIHILIPANVKFFNAFTSPGAMGGRHCITS